jgi:hypothetical protein
MSNDLGNHHGADDPYGIKARFRAEMSVQKMSLAELSKQAGISEQEAKRALDQCEDDLFSSHPTLVRLQMVLGKDLICGTCSANDPLKTRLMSLVWEFTDGLEIPPNADVTTKFMNWVINRFATRVYTNASAAFRAGAPQSVIDVGRLFERFKAEMR